MTDEKPQSVADSSVNRREFLEHAGALGGLSVLGRLRDGARSDPEYGPRAEADVAAVTKPVAVREFPVLDPETNERTGETHRWRTVKGTGNCCENYLATSPDGRLLDMGGDRLRISPDRGRSWEEVTPPNQPYPIIASEGCISAAPGGDVCAIDWDPYSPDRVIAFKYVAEEGTWFYTEVPLHTPFYDRPWFAVLPGPFDVGATVPYITVMRGGFPVDEVLYLSLDGLNYQLASSRLADSLVQVDVERFLTDVGDEAEPGIVDWVQPHTEGGFVPLGDGQALAAESIVRADVSFFEAGCRHAILNPEEGVGPANDLQWACFDTPTGLDQERTQVDADGTVHQVEFETDRQFVYRVSGDGGHTWTRHRFTLPGEYTVAGGALSRHDFKVLTAANPTSDVSRDLTAIAVHGSRESQPDGAKEDPGDPSDPDDQDILYKVWNPTSDDPDAELFYVGDDHLSYISGVSTDERFDFSTLAILPDGRVALSFADRTDDDPMVAVEAPGADPAYFFDVTGSRTDAADVYTAGQTARIDLTVEPTWVPRDDLTAAVRDRVPIDWTVYDNPQIDRVEERPAEGVTLVYFVADAVNGEETSYTYFVEVADDTDETGEYTVGPAQVEPENPDQIETVDADEPWVDVPGTVDRNVVAGASAEF